MLNIAERAVLSARAADLVKLTREKITAAVEAPRLEREPILVDAMELAVQAIDALSELCLDARPDA